MNAYEIAKELSEFMTEDKYTDLDKTIFKTCNMLRQQADELEAFKLNFYNTGYTLQLRDKDETIRQQADRIAELEKSHIELEKGIVADLNQRQSAKPVAWMDYLEHSNVYDLNVSGRGIPLYTAPQIKQLSDEELNKAFDYYCETDEGVLRFNYELRDEWKKEQLIRWKEALKKASEK